VHPWLLLVVGAVAGERLLPPPVAPGPSAAPGSSSCAGAGGAGGLASGTPLVCRGCAPRRPLAEPASGGGGGKVPRTLRRSSLWNLQRCSLRCAARGPPCCRPSDQVPCERLVVSDGPSEDVSSPPFP